MGLYSSWKYRAYIRITNPATVEGFQHRMVVSWLPGMSGDFRDIRFTTLSGRNCPYWIESYTSRSSAIVWIKVTDALQGGIFLRYGNGQAISASSGDSTFEFFDDFSGAALDTTTKWGLTAGTPSISNGILSVTSTSSGANRYLYSKNYTHGDNIIVYAKMRHTSGDWNHNIALCVDYSGLKEYAVGPAGVVSSEYLFKHNTGFTALTSTSKTSGSSSAFYEYEVAKLSGSTNNLKSRLGSTIPSTWDLTASDTALSNNRVGVQFYKDSGSTTFELDIFYVRKYTATEPTLSIVWHGTAVSSAAIVAYLGSLPYTGTEYSFDPVNIDHGIVPGDLGVEYDIATVGVSHNIAAGVGVVEIEMAPAEILHAIYPTATWDRVIQNPTDDTGTLISVLVSRGKDDAMTQATFEYDSDSVGNIFSNDYMTKIVVKIPDFSGTERIVFVGIAPSSRAVYSPAADKMTLTAVDYGLFLTKQVLEDKDLALLPPGEQSADQNMAKVLSYDYSTTPFQIGQKIVGGTSKASGRIIEIAQGASWRVTLYPATGSFVDNEDLLVGGVKFAQADGRSVDIPYAPYWSVTNPEDWIRSVLGGSNWMRVTGIEPYKIVGTSGYWDTEDCPAVPFMFGSKEKKFDAIKRLVKYLRYIDIVKPRDSGGGNYVPSYYCVPESLIDDPVYGLDLPAPAYLTGPNDPYLAVPIELEQNGENQVDLVRVTCQDLNGTWLESKQQNSRVSSGEGPYLELYDEPQDIATQEDLDDYCLDLFNLYSSRGATWTATLLDRSDLQIYQLLIITGYGAKIPNGTYRIIKISYERSCAVNKVHVTFMLASAFSTLLRLGRTYTDSITEIQRIVHHELDKTQYTELGTCIANDGITVTYETEAKIQGRGRDGTII